MRASHFSEDIQEFFVLLCKHGVKYVIVGGEAVIYYGYARLTGDVDFFYERTEENVNRLFRALSDFWQGAVPGIDNRAELLEEGTIIQFGLPPNRIDLINKLDGVGFEDVWANKVTDEMEIDDRTIPVYFIGIDSLITNKKCAGRHKDLEDLQFLVKAKQEGNLP